MRMPGTEEKHASKDCRLGGLALSFETDCDSASLRQYDNSKILHILMLWIMNAAKVRAS